MTVNIAAVDEEVAGLLSPKAENAFPLSETKKDANGVLLRPVRTTELDNGFELWLVPVEMLIEQSINARVMGQDAFHQLSQNITERGGLESLPFCALTEHGLEIVSGHHRIRSCRKVGITEAWVLVDVTGLTRDQIKAKQLAHNSLQGKDDMSIVQAIFASIGDADARIEAFVDVDLGDLVDADVKLSSKELEINLDTRTVMLAFLPLQKKAFEEAVRRIEAHSDVVEMYLATKEEYDLLTATVAKVSEKYDIRAIPTVFAKMAEIVNGAMVEEVGGGE